MKKIPLKPETPRYSFNILLDDNLYEFGLRWNSTAEMWFLSIVGISNGVLIQGIGLACGQNLLKPFGCLDLGGLYVLDMKGKTDPTFESLGVRHLLFYVPRDEPDDII